MGGERTHSCLADVSKLCLKSGISSFKCRVYIIQIQGTQFYECSYTLGMFYALSILFPEMLLFVPQSHLYASYFKLLGLDTLF